MTISKSFDFCASHRCRVPGWPDDRNLDIYGNESRGSFGHGHNYVAHLAFHGPVDKTNGMMINVAIIKERIAGLIEKRYDHKFLNVDTVPFDKTVPTPENIARELLNELYPLFDDLTAKPVACHLLESPTVETTAYEKGAVERSITIQFSAARTTMSPHLSEKENAALFGNAAAVAGHGHNYRLRVTIAGEVDKTTGLITADAEARETLEKLRLTLDHRNLNIEIDGFGNQPMTSECLARYLWSQLERKLPIVRLRLHENDSFFVEYKGDNNFSMGLSQSFLAAHRLHSESLSPEENRSIYGVCNNEAGHGHEYNVEATFEGKLDERSGTLFSLEEQNRLVCDALADWNYRHLDNETSDFNDRPSTGENIIARLWDKIDAANRGILTRLRLWETENNRFTLRRNPPA